MNVCTACMYISIYFFRKTHGKCSCCDKCSYFTKDSISMKNDERVLTSLTLLTDCLSGKLSSLPYTECFTYILYCGNCQCSGRPHKVKKIQERKSAPWLQQVTEGGYYGKNTALRQQVILLDKQRQS